ncbi:MAG: hypothetical protein Q7R76_00915 [Candidatus Woesearchaeota archaeon]|nr:hypothetical protein [Candidatus Woesearchaeota archaeon]
MGNIDDLVPNYREGDFRGERPFREEFRGLVYHLTYPVIEVEREMLFWTNQGYRVGIIYGFMTEKGPASSFNVYGDIPVWAQDKLKQSGVTVTLKKPRGEFERI